MYINEIAEAEAYAEAEAFNKHEAEQSAYLTQAIKSIRCLEDISRSQVRDLFNVISCKMSDSANFGEIEIESIDETIDFLFGNFNRS